MRKKTPIFCTRTEQPHPGARSCTETQSNNQRAVAPPYRRFLDICHAVAVLGMGGYEEWVGLTTSKRLTITRDGHTGRFVVRIDNFQLIITTLARVVFRSFRGVGKLQDKPRHDIRCMGGEFR